MGSELTEETLNNIGYSDVFFAKYDANGAVLSVEIIGAGSYEFADAITLDLNGNIYISGIFNDLVMYFGATSINVVNPAGGLGGDYDPFIVKYDSNINVQWAKSIHGSLQDHINGIAPDVNGNIYVTGYFNSYRIYFDAIMLPNSDTNGGYADVFIAKINGGSTDINDSNYNYNEFVFPNPSNGIFNFSNLAKESSIEIYDITGRKVYQKQISENNFKIDMSDKNKGAYFYRVINKNNHVQQGKLILQ